MAFAERMRRGWELAKTSLSVINKDKTLLLFPIMSTISLIFVIASFFGGITLVFGLENLGNLFQDEESTNILGYFVTFMLYLINYFIIIFFNAALIHCAIKHLNDEPASVGDGINFALSKITRIFSWALVAATVGLILNAIQNKSGKFGQIIIGLIGMAWSFLTFFMVPVMIYENLGVVDSVKRSGQIIKKTWGEALTANFGFGFIMFGGILALIPVGILLGMINPIVAIVVVVLLFAIIAVTYSAAKTIFVAAAYQHATGGPTGVFENSTLDDIFVSKN